jgi:hypothetical protein
VEWVEVEWVEVEWEGLAVAATRWRR